MTEHLAIDRADLDSALRAARNLPKELRADLKSRVGREVVSPVAKQVQLAAGASTLNVVRAFRSRGVAVKPGEEPMLVVGGTEPFGTKANMRRIAAGAEFGTYRTRTSYQRKGRKRKGRARGATHGVSRDAGVQMGNRVPDGRFVFPTMLREAPRMADSFVTILDDIVGATWRGGR